MKNSPQQQQICKRNVSFDGSFLFETFCCQLILFRIDKVNSADLYTGITVAFYQIYGMFSPMKLCDVYTAFQE